MITPDPRLTELLDAAQKLLEEGGTVTNRNRLRAALAAIPMGSIPMPITRPFLVTPTVEKVIARACELANASNDLFLRSQHLMAAFEELK
jgi:hypothetical protein